LIDVFDGVLLAEAAVRAGVAFEGVEVGFTTFARVGLGGAAVALAAFALEEAVPCINLEADDGAVIFGAAVVAGTDVVVDSRGCGFDRLCLATMPDALPSERLFRFSAASFALARLEAVGLEGVPVIWERKGVGVGETGFLPPGVVDDARTGPVWEGVSLEPDVRENEEGGALDGLLVLAGVMVRALVVGLTAGLCGVSVEAGLGGSDGVVLLPSALAGEAAAFVVDGGIAAAFAGD
jgi:hypothetical protein